MSQRHSHGEHSGKLAQGMLRTAQENYGRLITAARKGWERKFAGSDPSDACVTVRISAGDSRELAKFFPLVSSHRLEPFLTN